MFIYWHDQSNIVYMLARVVQKKDMTFVHRATPTRLPGFHFKDTIFSVHRQFKLVYNLHHNLESKEILINLKLHTHRPPYFLVKQTVSQLINDIPILLSSFFPHKKKPF